MSCFSDRVDFCFRIKELSKITPWFLSGWCLFVLFKLKISRVLIYPIYTATWQFSNISVKNSLDRSFSLDIDGILEGTGLVTQFQRNINENNADQTIWKMKLIKAGLPKQLIVIQSLTPVLATQLVLSWVCLHRFILH